MMQKNTVMMFLTLEQMNRILHRRCSKAGKGTCTTIVVVHLNLIQAGSNGGTGISHLPSVFVFQQPV